MSSINGINLPNTIQSPPSDPGLESSATTGTANISGPEGPSGTSGTSGTSGPGGTQQADGLDATRNDPQVSSASHGSNPLTNTDATLSSNITIADLNAAPTRHADTTGFAPLDNMQTTMNLSELLLDIKRAKAQDTDSPAQTQAMVDALKAEHDALAAKLADIDTQLKAANAELDKLDNVNQGILTKGEPGDNGQDVIKDRIRDLTDQKSAVEDTLQHLDDLGSLLAPSNASGAGGVTGADPSAEPINPEEAIQQMRDIEMKLEGAKHDLAIAQNPHFHSKNKPDEGAAQSAVDTLSKQKADLEASIKSSPNAVSIMLEVLQNDSGSLRNTFERDIRINMQNPPPQLLAMTFGTHLSNTLQEMSVLLQDHSPGLTPDTNQLKETLTQLRTIQEESINQMKALQARFEQSMEQPLIGESVRQNFENDMQKVGRDRETAIKSLFDANTQIGIPPPVLIGIADKMVAMGDMHKMLEGLKGKENVDSHSLEDAINKLDAALASIGDGKLAAQPIKDALTAAIALVKRSALKDTDSGE